MNGRLAVLGTCLAVLGLAAPARIEAQCTLASTPVQFEGNLPNGTQVPLGAPRPILLTPGSSALSLYHNAAGAPRLLNAETFGYSILDLSNPANPTAIKYDDFRFDSPSSTTNTIPTHGDGQSYIATTAVSPDGQRIAFGMNGPASPPWHTLAGRSDGNEGFGMWGDFPPLGSAMSTVVQKAGGRYIAYSMDSVNRVYAADITSLPTSNSAFGPLNIPYETTGMPGGGGMILVGNYLVYTTSSGVLTVYDASNPGPGGSIASGFKSASIPYLSTDPSHRAPANYTAALDPGDSTKLWILIEVSKNYPSENSPSYGLVSVTKDGSGNLTVNASPGLFRVPAQTGESWSNAGYASSLVAQNGFLFVIMWAWRSAPTTQYGFFSTTVSAWPAVSPFQAVTAPAFNLPATSAVVLAASGNSVYQYFPTGPRAFAIPFACVPLNVPAVSSLAVTNTSAGTTLSSGDSVFLGDVLTVVPFVGPLPVFNPLTSWAFDFDFHAVNPIEDAGAPPRIKNPDNGVFGNPANPPAQAILTGPCDPKGVPAGDPPSGTNCWTSILNNATTGGPDFTGSDPAGTTKPLEIAFEATNAFGIGGTAVFTVNWVVPAARVVSTHFLSGKSLVSASDGHPLASGYKWYFGNSPTTLTPAAACVTSTCLPTTSPLAGTYYYWLKATYANGYATPDYDGVTHVGLPFTVTNFAPSFTVNGSTAGPVSAYTSQNLTISNSSQRGSGITGSYSYDICLSSCTATYTGPTGGAFTAMTDPSSLSGAPPSSATLALPSTAGPYTLRLRINYAGGTAYWPDPSGATGFALNVTDRPPPIVVTASATPNPANSGDTIQLSCSATGGSGTFTYQWLTTLGAFSSLQNPTLRLTNAGPGLVTSPLSCFVTDSNGASGSASFTLTIRPAPPVVTAAATPNPVANGSRVQFACSATGGSGIYTSYSWSNSTGVFSVLRSPTIVASNPASTAITSPVTCTVTDGNGAQSSGTVNLTINGAIPIVVTATATPNPAAYGATVQFGCSASGGTGNFASYSWSTSAGTFSSAQSPTQKVTNPWNTPTATPATCTVTDSMGGVGSGTVNVTVNPVAPRPSSFYTLPPCRLLDTRNATGALGGPAIQGAGTTADRVFALTSTCGVPLDAKSLSVNVTVANVSAAGDLSLYRGDGVQNGTTTVALRAGTTRANNASLQLALDGSGTIKVQNTSAGTVDLVIDVNGFFR